MLFLHPLGVSRLSCSFLVAWLTAPQPSEKHVRYRSSLWATAVGDLATPITFLTDLYPGCPLLNLQTSHPDFCSSPKQTPSIPSVHSLPHSQESLRKRKSGHLMLQVLLWFPNHRRKSQTLNASKACVAYFLILNCCSLVTSALTD